MPRSVAFVVTQDTPLNPGTTDQWVVAQLDTHESVIAVEVPGTNVNNTMRVVKPMTPLAEQTTIHVFGWKFYEYTYQTNSTIDDVPPSEPEIESGSLSQHDGGGGCGQPKDSCGDFTSMYLRLKALPSDDQTPAARLVYAIYLGSSPEEVQASANASFLSTGWSDRELWESVGSEWMNRDAYAALAIIDQSGNVSQRSTPVQINAADSGGCIIRGRKARGRFASVIMFAVMAIGSMRRGTSRCRAGLP